MNFSMQIGAWRGRETWQSSGVVHNILFSRREWWLQEKLALGNHNVGLCSACLNISKGYLGNLSPECSPSTSCQHQAMGNKRMTVYVGIRLNRLDLSKKPLGKPLTETDGFRLANCYRLISLRVVHEGEPELKFNIFFIHPICCDFSPCYT